MSSPNTCQNQKQVASILGSLQHITVIYQQGRTHLPALSRFLSKFPNVHILHHIPTNVMHELKWWSCTLTVPNPTRSLTPLPALDLDIWVDASMSVRVGILIDNRWSAWYLTPGWNSNGRDIGWAEAVVIELVVVWLASNGLHDGCLTVNCDNTSVIQSIWKGHSRNPWHNNCLLRISSCLAASNLTINPCYAQSGFNKVDGLSRGILCAPELRLRPSVTVPVSLSSYLVQL